MEAPKNLLDAVDRLKPTAILLLDTNTIMSGPRLEAYQIAAPGPFLFALPTVVYAELMNLKRGHKDRGRRERASRRLSEIDDLFARRDPTQGIELSGDRWLISIPLPKWDESIEDQQARRTLGKVDATLLRLSIACAEDCPGTPTLLVTGDTPLRGFARIHGLPVCELPDLRSLEELNKKLGDAALGAATELDIASLVSPEEERTVRVTMTLEELRSEGDELIARGVGRLVDHQERFPFRWTFPCNNLSGYDEVTDAVMPSENLDFMCADEQVPEPVKNFVCGILEDSGGGAGSWALQSPKTQVRLRLTFEMAMDARFGGFFRPGHIIHKRGLSPEKAERYDRLSKEHDRLMQSLIDGRAESVGDTYRSAFELRRDLEELLGWDEEYDNDLYGPGPFDLETSLIVLLADAMSTWSVGETREEEFTYRPLAFPEYEPDAVVDEEEDGDEVESY